MATKHSRRFSSILGVFHHLCRSEETNSGPVPETLRASYADRPGAYFIVLHTWTALISRERHSEPCTINHHAHTGVARILVSARPALRVTWPLLVPPRHNLRMVHHLHRATCVTNFNLIVRLDGRYVASRFVIMGKRKDRARTAAASEKRRQAEEGSRSRSRHD